MLSLLVLLLQAAAPAPAIHETRHLSVTTSVQAANSAKDRRLVLAADVTPKPTMHVYAPGQDGFIVVTLTIDPQPGVTAAKAVFPAPEKFKPEGLDQAQLIYAKPFRITAAVTRDRAAAAQAVTVHGSLRYQACDDRICYLPQTVPLEWTIPSGQTR